MKTSKVILILVGIIGLSAFLYIPGLIDKNQSKHAAEEVLDHVINQHYDKAFEHVYFFDRASDTEPEISYEDAKKKWIERLIDLREQGIYLVDYDQLRIRLDDTYPRGNVNLVFMENGERKIKENVSLWFAPRENKWKLGNFDYHHDVEEWEHALSGNFN
ncbi:hypothetical protein [Rossellomorea sp. NS-SX7]|uniref:hypothetical protein n=1 Tax=Rossellomorea sp. NS-SX7 TaxID=3463856 RepID=UPI004059EA9B